MTCVQYSIPLEESYTKALGVFLQEFLMALDVTQCRSDREKLQWAFRLYDVDNSGTINVKEMASIIETMDQVSSYLSII